MTTVTDRIAQSTSGTRLNTERGRPGPLGVSVQGQQKNFAVFADGPVTLLLFLSGPDKAPVEVALNCTGHVYHVSLADLPDDFEYAYRRQDSDLLLLDPYARSVAGGEVWGEMPQKSRWAAPWDRVRERRSRYVVPSFEWGDDAPVRIPMQNSVIYEMQLRGFTQNSNSGVAAPGTYRGLIEKIPYLQQLGITSVELLPVMEFEENDNPRNDPAAEQPVWNYWGYHTLSFFAPNASYASVPGKEIDEFREMVKALHAAGMEVILDVVYNHTGEADIACPTFSFRGLADSTYYAIDRPSGEYRNDTGCGNTFSTNHPVVQDLTIDSLRYWVTEMHVDGFRFDLASIFYRGASGEVLDRPPIIDRISQDPVLADVKLIAEPWDAVGLYHVGDFARGGRWAEWNDHFRDHIRQFVKSEPNKVKSLSACLAGNPGTYHRTTDTVNFVACHDGFTLADVASFNEKHNQVNGENGRDGSSSNHSWNCGAEGPTDDPGILQLRQQQMKNMVSLLFMAQGVPMLLAGDEFGRTQQGNNNGYCVDSPQTWVDWALAETNAGLLRFCQKLIRLRQDHLPRWIDEGETFDRIRWHGCEPCQPDFSEHSRSLAMQVLSHGQGSELLLIANAFWEQLTFRLPDVASGGRWCQVVDTAAVSPSDFIDPNTAKPVDGDAVPAAARSVMVFIAR